MAFFEPKRQTAFLLALLLFVFLLISPLLDVYGEHDHSCSPAECALCITANAISVLRKASLIALLTCAALPAILRLYEGIRIFTRIPTSASPVALKTELIS